MRKRKTYKKLQSPHLHFMIFPAIIITFPPFYTFTYNFTAKIFSSGGGGGNWSMNGGKI